MTITADAGSTKTTWRIDTHTASPLYLHTQGISPIHQGSDEIRQILASELRPRVIELTVTLCAEVADVVTDIRFYGAGCLPHLCPVVEQALRDTFPEVQHISVDSDLMGAAIALCGHQPGIACILGTGANSGLYDGCRIVRNTPPMGYVLGDEGSGAALGKQFLNLLYKGQLDAQTPTAPEASLRSLFESETGLCYADIIRRVYREPLAARFLASLSPFIRRHTDHAKLREMVIDCFRSFFRLHIAPYRVGSVATIAGVDLASLPVNFVGSIAYHYRDLLAVAAEAEGFTLGRVQAQPL